MCGGFSSMEPAPASRISIAPETVSGPWLDALQSRMHVNKVTVALAAKIARMTWAIITKPGALYQRRDPAVA